MNYPWLETTWQQWQQMQARLGHAYLLSGAEGIGLDEFALQMAKGVLCSHSQAGHGCDQCQGCHLFGLNQHPDFYHLRRLEDKKEITVAQVRELIEHLNETAHQGGFKAIWVEEVERLNQSAFNALLKNLEEPAARTVFILTTHQISRLPATVRSRCQILTAQPPQLNDAQNWLQASCPQLDMPLIKRALRLNWGAPLSAKKWLDNGLFEQDQAWSDGLKQLQNAQKTPSQLVSAWLKWEQPEQVFDYFYQWAVSAVRSVAYKSDTTPDQLSHGQNVNWLNFQRSILTAKQSWHQNANKELVLECLCIEWMQIQTGQQQVDSVFTDPLIRGQL